MKIHTQRFGEMNVEASAIIHFPHGLPGFEELHQYIIITPDEELPVSFMQSVDDGNTSFIITSPFTFYPKYEFEVSEAIQQELQIESKDEVIIWSVVSIHEDLTKSTLNLLAPVIINARERLGKQIILHGSNYQTRHKFMLQSESSSETLDHAEETSLKGEIGC